MVDEVDGVDEQVGCKVDRGSTGLMSRLTRLTIGSTGLMSRSTRLTEVDKTIRSTGLTRRSTGSTRFTKVD